jgi:sugar O-acyltransferase (sialic acid O-acetyltransferase NeuD family)
MASLWRLTDAFDSMSVVKQKLVIIGAGGFGREVLAWARQSTSYERDWTIKGFIDDCPTVLEGRNPPAPLLSSIADYVPAGEDVFICAMGVPDVKRRASELLLSRGARFTRVIHRTAIIGDNVQMSEGVIMCPYSVASANNWLGFGVALNLHATVDHDASVGDWSQVNCHCDLTADVKIGREVFLGSRVSVIPGVEIGDRAYLGAGSVVTRNIPAGARAYGVPARVHP